MRLTARLVAGAALIGLAALPAQAATVVVAADRMIDVATGGRVERPLVVITDGRITRVGRQGDALPEGAERVDLPMILYNVPVRTITDMSVATMARAAASCCDNSKRRNQHGQDQRHCRLPTTPRRRCGGGNAASRRQCL